LPSTLAFICLSCCRAGSWDPLQRPHLYRQPALLLWAYGYQEYRAQHPCRGGFARCSSWSGKHVSQVSSGRFCTRAAAYRRVAVRSLPSVLNCFRLCSPRPTPVVEDTVSANPQAHDCIQVRSPGASSVVEISGDECALAAHGVDFRNGRSNVQHLSTEARRVRAHFSYARSKGPLFFALATEID
jgi:hypothetical protein